MARSGAAEGARAAVAPAPATWGTSGFPATEVAARGRCPECATDDDAPAGSAALGCDSARRVRPVPGLRAGNLASRRTPNRPPRGAGDVSVRAECVGMLPLEGGVGVIPGAPVPPPALGV